MIFNNITELIGKTPVMDLSSYGKEVSAKSRLLGKLEFFNPAGSVKDRVGAAMIKAAEEDGRLTKDSVIVEPTSGNTGIGLAAVAASRGYRAVIVMPDTMSVERRRLIGAYGAEIILTDGKLGMKGAIDKADEICSENKNAILAGQFTNPCNPLAHYTTTGPEIWEDTEGKIDVFVAGIGTGGTISGVGKYLKEKNPNIKIIGVEPAGSPYLTTGVAGPHGLQGIGAGFVPDTLDLSVVDEIVCVKDEEAYAAGRLLATKEGILVGITSGACAFAMGELSKREEFAEGTILALFPDTGERYLSTPMFS